jgi:glc operon protein GlcG
VRTLFGLVVSSAALMAASAPARAQDYLLPDAPGKTQVTDSCEACHGIITVIKHKRSPQQWVSIVQMMTVEGLVLNNQQKKRILGYLDAHYSQATDYVPLPPLLRGHGPGVDLALEAAQAARAACHAKGQTRISTLVVDSGGVPVVLLTDDEAKPINQIDAQIKVAAVLKYKQSSGEVMKRVDRDPVLEAEIKADSQIGLVLSGGLPIIARGNEIVGAIAVSGVFGPANLDDLCAQAGLDRITSRLK